MKLSAENLADDLRIRYWGNKFPVDPMAIAKGLGIDVIQVHLPDDVFGIIFKEKDKDAIIAAEKDDSYPRQRFTIAHELGHYVHNTNQDGFDNTMEFVDLRGNFSPEETDPQEIFANQFAAYLLMPKDKFDSLKKKKSKVMLASFFMVSPEAVSVRMAK